MHGALSLLYGPFTSILGLSRSYGGPFFSVSPSPPVGERGRGLTGRSAPALHSMCWHLQMKIVSLAYFMAFGIFVPTASHMILYGLYLLRTYLLEYAATEVAARQKISETLMDKMPLRSRSVLSIVAKPKPKELRRLSLERDEHAISVLKSGTSGQANVLTFESGSEGRKVRLKSVFTRPTERRRSSVFPTWELPEVLSEATVEEFVSNEQNLNEHADSSAALKGGKTD